MDPREEGNIHPSNITAIDLNVKMARLSDFYSGIMEDGENSGRMIEAFQKSVDGQARGEAWCMGFVQYVVTQVCGVFGVTTDLYKSESVHECFNKTPLNLRFGDPRTGDIAMWDRGHGLGHCGIIQSIYPDGILCTEGNTKLHHPSLSRDGVYLRFRPFASGLIRLGYLRAFP